MIGTTLRQFWITNLQDRCVNTAVFVNMFKNCVVNTNIPCYYTRWWAEVVEWAMMVQNHPREYLNNLVKDKGRQMRSWHFFAHGMKYNPCGIIPCKSNQLLMMSQVGHVELPRPQLIQKNSKPTWERDLDATLEKVGEAIIEWYFWNDKSGTS